MYLIYPDRTEPDAYERTLPEVFPDTAPGNFTEVPELGTDCQNQPEAHLLVQACRALTRLAAPGLLLKAEAIVSPDMLVQYLGGRYRPECDLAYDNQLMVMLWSALASRDVRLAEHALSRRRPAPEPTAWASYLRCHDDIGWAVSDADAAAVGLDGFSHRRFLSDFYAGHFPGSFARGALFQENPVTGDADLRHCRIAMRHPDRADRGPPGRAQLGHQATRVDVRRRLLLRRHPADLYGR